MKIQPVFAALIGACLPFFVISQNPFSPPPPTVSVSGTAEIKVVPDEIYLSMAVETKDGDLGHSKLGNDSRVENALKFLKQNGVKSADVKSGTISVRPEYEYNPETGQQENVKFYVVTRQLEFKLTNPDKFDDLLTGLMESGVNYVNDVRFATTKLREHRDEARRQAAKAAREKAELLCKELGAKAGKVTSISEGYQDFYPMYGNQGPAYQQNISMGGEGSGQPMSGSLSVGLITVSATVNASFLIE